MRYRPRLDPITSNGVDLLHDPHAGERGWMVGFFSRRGGVSETPFDTLNLAARGGDLPDRVTENRRRAAEALGFPPGDLALARQVHGASVLEVARGESGVVGEADVLVVREAGPVLGILTADCAPVVVAGSNGVAIAHAGWKGLVAGAVEAAVRAVAPVMAAWVGPCIHSCCYEVGPEVIDAFESVGLPVAAPNRVDPAAASVFALSRSGVASVALADACTCCDAGYFSYRRDGVTGRQGAFVARIEAGR
jgi:purine-nucleoside/S-methyl-5'-thioadenosine phosphorylase / adenosine deaminase